MLYESRRILMGIRIKLCFHSSLRISSCYTYVSLDKIHTVGEFVQDIKLRYEISCDIQVMFRNSPVHESENILVLNDAVEIRIAPVDGKEVTSFSTIEMKNLVEDEVNVPRDIQKSESWLPCKKRLSTRNGFNFEINNTPNEKQNVVNLNTEFKPIEQCEVVEPKTDGESTKTCDQLGDTHGSYIDKRKRKRRRKHSRPAKDEIIVNLINSQHINDLNVKNISYFKNLCGKEVSNHIFFDEDEAEKSTDFSEDRVNESNHSLMHTPFDCRRTQNTKFELNNSSNVQTDAVDFSKKPLSLDVPEDDTFFNISHKGEKFEVSEEKQSDKFFGTLLMCKKLTAVEKYNVEFYNTPRIASEPKLQVLENASLSLQENINIPNGNNITDCEMILQRKIVGNVIYTRTGQSDWKVLTVEDAINTLEPIYEFQENQCITFQLVYLSANMCPTVSDLFCATVISFEKNCGTLRLAISSAFIENLLKDCPEEFSLPDNLTWIVDNAYEVPVSALINIRLLM